MCIQVQRQRHKHETSEHIMLPHTPIPKFVILSICAVTCSIMLPEHPTYGQNLHRQVHEVAASGGGATSACFAAKTCDCSCVSHVALNCTVEFMQHELSWCVLLPRSSCDSCDTSYMQYTKSPDNDIKTYSSHAVRSIAGSKSQTCQAASTQRIPESVSMWIAMFGTLDCSIGAKTRLARRPLQRWLSPQCQQHVCPGRLYHSWWGCPRCFVCWA